MAKTKVNLNDHKRLVDELLPGICYMLSLIPNDVGADAYKRKLLALESWLIEIKALTPLSPPPPNIPNCVHECTTEHIQALLRYRSEMRKRQVLLSQLGLTKTDTTDTTDDL